MASEPGQSTVWMALLILSLLVGGAGFAYLADNDDNTETSNSQPPEEEVTPSTGNQTTNTTDVGTPPPTNSTVTCGEGLSLLNGVCVEDEEDDDHSGHGHDHGTPPDTNTSTPQEPARPPVELPLVPPTINSSASGAVNLSTFTHLPTNTTIAIDLGVEGSAVTVTPSLPQGLIINEEGTLSGTVSSPARNLLVNFTTTTATQEVAFTFYDLEADHNQLTNEASATFGQGLTGGITIPLLDAGLGYAQSKSSEPFMSAVYLHGSRVVAVPGDGLLLDLQGYAKHAALDAALDWACPDASTVYLLIDNQTLSSTADLEADLQGLGYSVGANLSSSDCLLGSALGPLASPAHLTSWLTGTRGAVLMGHQTFLNSVEHGDAFFTSGELLPLVFDLAEETYDPMLNGLSAIEAVMAGGSSLTEEDLALVTVETMFSVPRSGFIHQIDTDSFGPLFLDRLGATVREANWMLYNSAAPTASNIAGENARLLIKSAYLQNLRPDEGYVDGNAATYPGIAGAPLVPQTVSLNLSDTVIAQHRGGPSRSCSADLVHKVVPVWANAGSEVIVTVPQELVDEGLAVFIGIHCYDTLVGSSTAHGYARSPSMVVVRNIVDVETRLTSGFGGLMMIGFPEGASLGVHSVTFENVSAAPHYLHQSTSVSQWSAQKSIDVPWAVVESSQILLALPTTMVANWTDPSTTMAFLDNGTSWMHWFHGIAATHQRQTIWYTDYDMDANPSAWMYGVDPIRSAHGLIVPDLHSNDTTTAVHWSILHEVAHLHEPVSPPTMSEPWADFAVTAYYSMVHDLEIWETYKGPTSNRSNFVFSLDSYLDNPAAGLGEYSGSPGYVLFWMISEEHGYDVFQQAILSMDCADMPCTWDGWAVQLSQATNQNMCTLFQAMMLDLSPTTVSACEAYAEWTNHPIRNTGSNSASDK